MIVETLVNQVMARAAASRASSLSRTKKSTIQQEEAQLESNQHEDELQDIPQAQRDSIMSKKTTPVPRTLSPSHKSEEMDASVFKNTNIVSKLSEKEIRIQVVSEHQPSEGALSPDKIKPLLKSRNTSMKSKSEKILTPSVKP